MLGAVLVVYLCTFMPKVQKKYSQILADFFELLVVAVGIFALLWFFLAEPLEVTGKSMVPTLLDKEQLIAEKISINFEEPKRGEIVVFRSPDKNDVLLIKRIVGLPNEQLELKDGLVYINGELLVEPYLQAGTATVGKKAIKEGEEFTIPANSFVMMGDNRENSSDSRTFGTITRDLLVGRAFLVYHPWENFRLISVQ